MDLGASLVVPKLGLGLSTAWSPGSPRVTTMAWTACLQCVGTSIVIVGPVAKVKKLGRQAMMRGIESACGCPKVNRHMHFCVCIGACVPETTMRVGGVSSVVSAIISFHFGCSSGWSHTSVMSLTFWHAGYGSNGVATTIGACSALVFCSFLAKCHDY